MEKKKNRPPWLYIQLVDCLPDPCSYFDFKMISSTRFKVKRKDIPKLLSELEYYELIQWNGHSKSKIKKQIF